MVDRYPDRPQDNEGQAAFFSDFEFDRTFFRMEKIAVAHALLAKATELDGELVDKGLTKKFVSKSAGESEGGRYTFPHLRVKLKPKNHSKTDITVVALRFPSDIQFNPVQDKLYVAYENPTGEHAFYLSAGQYSRLEPDAAFHSPGMGVVLEPDVSALTSVDAFELLALESILGTDGQFEPDLQDHNPDVAA